MDELSWQVKIIGVALCIAAVILLAAHDRLLKIFRRSPKESKAK